MVHSRPSELAVRPLISLAAILVVAGCASSSQTAGGGAPSAGPAPASATATEAPRALEDSLAGTTVGARPRGPGALGPDGWVVTSGQDQIKYDLGRLYPKGTIEFEVKGPLKQGGDAKTVLFALWDDETATDGDRKSQGFMQIRLQGEGILLRLTNRTGGRSFEQGTGPLPWEADRWYRFKATWDTAGGNCSVWRDGELVKSGKFNNAMAGLRWAFIGRDNYKQMPKYEAVPEIAYRNLKITARD